MAGSFWRAAAFESPRATVIGNGHVLLHIPVRERKKTRKPLSGAYGVKTASSSYGICFLSGGASIVLMQPEGGINLLLFREDLVHPILVLEWLSNLR